jgi:hypothetical protein
VLETNLSRDELLQIAATLPVTGEHLPRAWLSAKASAETLTLAQARRRTSFPLRLPTLLPEGYAVTTVHLTNTDGVTGVTVTFAPADPNAADRPIELHVEPATGLPATTSDLVKVSVDGVSGRWDPHREELDWVEGGRLLSLRAPGRPLSTVMAMALTIPPAGS